MKHEVKDFVGQCNNASVEAKKEGVTSKELAENFLKMAFREFKESEQLQEEYDNFAEFAIDIEFEVQEQERDIEEALDKVDEYLDE